MTGCRECDALASGEARILFEDGLFAVHPILGGGAVPGWLVVAPRRHVEQLDALTPEEEAALFPLVAKVGRALRASTPCEKLYVTAFGEVVSHLHLHVIARPPSLAAEGRGAKIFASTEKAAASDVDAVASRVAAILR